MIEMEAVRLPRLLKRELEAGGTLREAGRLRPAALSAELNLTPLSHAEMTLNEDDLPVRVHDLVELYGQNGSLGVFRVVSVSTDYRRQRRVRMNHALDMLADAVMPGETRVTGNVRQALETILTAQTDTLDGKAFWQLGAVEDGGAYAYENDHGNALQRLIELARAEEEYCFRFDFSVFPWRLDFVRREARILSEFRLSRNVEKCQVTLDDSELCTRLYLSVESTAADANGEKTTVTHEVHDDAGAQAIWGVVSRTAGINTADVPDRAAWVRRYFARYGQPGVQITVDGMELNRLTGERMDEMRLGCLCRVALPDYDTVFEERIVSVRYPDLLRQPERVSVALANKRALASHSMSSLSRSAAANASAASKNSREIEKNKYSWKACDKHITDIGTILHEAGLEIDAHGVWAYAREENPFGALASTFAIQAGRIAAKADSTVVDDLGTRVGNAEISIDGINSEIKLKASKETVDALGKRVSTAESSLTVQAEQIQSKVSQTDFNGNTVASLINQTATTVTIQAQKIDLQGYVTASQLAAAFSEATLVSTQRLSVASSFYINGAYASWQSTNVVLSAWANKSSQRAFALTDGSKITGTYYMEPVTGIGTNTQPIFYLGRVDSD